MKRVIDGVTFDTQTAIKTAFHIKRGDDDRFVTAYMTPNGVSFYHIQKLERAEGHLQDWFDGDGEGAFWDEVYTVKSGEPIEEKTISVRMPNVLKSQIHELAKSEGLSANAWVVRALQANVARVASAPPMPAADVIAKRESLATDPPRRKVSGHRVRRRLKGIPQSGGDAEGT